MSETPKRDSGKGLHTSRWADIEKDSVHLERLRTLSDARAWIRKQMGPTEPRPA